MSDQSSKCFGKTEIGAKLQSSCMKQRRQQLQTSSRNDGRSGWNVNSSLGRTPVVKKSRERGSSQPIENARFARENPRKSKGFELIPTPESGVGSAEHRQNHGRSRKSKSRPRPPSGRPGRETGRRAFLLTRRPYGRLEDQTCLAAILETFWGMPRLEAGPRNPAGQRPAR